jgi:hypothetical protein
MESYCRPEVRRQFQRAVRQEVVRVESEGRGASGGVCVRRPRLKSATGSEQARPSLPFRFGSKGDGFGMSRSRQEGRVKISRAVHEK